MKVEYEPIELKFVIEDHDDDKPYSCVHGEYTDHDGTIIINCFELSAPEIVNVIIHEVLHKVINETGIHTTEKQDHFIIPHLMS